MPRSLRASIKASVKLSSLKFGSRIGLRLLSTIVLTRLLSPDIYGVFALVVMYRYLLEMFSDLGLRSVVLTKEDDTSSDFLQTIWTVSILRGAAIWAFTGLIALVIFVLQERGLFSEDSAYMASVLPLAIFALGGTTLIDGLRTANRFVYEREMQFGYITISQIAGNVVSLVVTIGVAWFFRSVWALVIGAYFQVLTLLILNHVFFDGPRMKLRLHRPSLRIIIQRGKWILGHSGLTAITMAADRLVLGLVMSSSAFGFYFTARQIVGFGLTFLNTVHSQMGLQVFRHIGTDDPRGFRRKYYKYRLFFDVLAGLGAGAGFVLAQSLVDIIFDDRYADVGPIVEILMLSLLPMGFLILREAYNAERKFRQMTIFSLLSTVTIWVGLLISVWAQDLTLSLLVIVFHRVPEAICLMFLSSKRGWLIPWRETLVFLFFGIGAGTTWGVVQVWNMML